ncbi:MAG TPA: histidinol dehydrogenase [Gammaproteobacteria bacterium]|nr:histidinol dehydrogenase [Gammaproteobacteria bacterium]
MQILDWTALDDAARANALARPALADDSERRAAVAAIIAAVRDGGDTALRGYTRRFDGVDLASPALHATDVEAAAKATVPSIRSAIDRAFDTIYKFHEPSGLTPYAVETARGVVCRRIIRPLKSVGLYAPGGSAALPSTVLMLGVPALLAGCEIKTLCTPPEKDGRVSPAILYAAHRCGIDTIIRAGGAQAIAAMAYGTETVACADKLFGPGNGWVTEAKRQAAADPDGASSDMPAGPSELLIVADDSADPAFIAADLLSQAEHGADSQVLLVTASAPLADAVRIEAQQQLESLPRRTIAKRALNGSRIILVPDEGSCLHIVNRYAPEHLILNVVDPEALLPGIHNAGSVFLGTWTPESLGDYVSGTNHVLPTYGYARQRGGLSVADFQKAMTVQVATADGLDQLGAAAITLARAEGLEAHARAVSLRLAMREDRRERA